MLTAKSCCTAHDDDSISSFCESREDSRIVRTTQRSGSKNGNNNNNNMIRKGHITNILPLTKPTPSGKRLPADIAVGIQEGVFLALDHFNRRSDAVLSYLPQRLKHCDFYFSWENRETMFSPIRAATEFLQVVQGDNEDEAQQEHNQDEEYHHHGEEDESCPPFAIVGAAMSTVTKNLAILGSAFDVPVISGVSTSTDLNGLPLFSRTTITNAGDAHAIAMYLQHLDVTHVAIVYKHDVWGIGYHGVLAKQFHSRDMNVLSLPYEVGHVEPIIDQLAKSQFRYVVAIIDDWSWRDICTLGYSYGVMGHSGYTWIIGDGMADLVAGANVPIDRRDETIARAMHGTSVITMDVPFHESFHQNALQIAQNRDIQKQSIRHFAQPKVFNDYNLTNGLVSVYAYLSFDAVMALGMAACDTPGLFTSEQFYQTLLSTQFDGVSGFVAFDPETHARSGAGVRYGVRNILLSEQLSTSTHFVLTNNVSTYVNTANNSIDKIRPHIYADNTTDVPPSLPALVQERNLVPGAAIVFGITFGVLVLLSSIMWMIWTYYHRNSAVVRASQPIFLCQLCVGTFIMGLSVIPLSFQDHADNITYRLDVACMSLPWLFSIGFVTSFSALFAKTWRLNKLFSGGMSCRRIQVQPRDVAWPFVILMSLNLIILVSWTLVDPMKWQRINVSNYDSFGRSQESYGDCQLNNKSFLIVFLLVNLAPVMIAMYQSYVGRKIPTEFSESYSLILSVASLLETTVLAVPVLVATVGNPIASYLVRSCFVCVFSLTILLPIFLPKYQQQQRRTRDGTNTTRSSTTAIRSACRTGGSTSNFRFSDRKSSGSLFSSSYEGQSATLGSASQRQSSRGVLKVHRPSRA